MKIGVFGAGYVGLVTAACLAEMGNEVSCCDVDADRVAGLERGVMPIVEPQLEDFVQRNLQARRLRFTTDAAETTRHGRVLFIAVGTPPSDDGSPDLGHVLDVAHAVGRAMQEHKVLVDKSTVPVGTADAVRAAVAGELKSRGSILPFAVVSNPEFLKEGSAIDDFMRPDRVILGCDAEPEEEVMRALYAPFLRNRDRLLTMDVRSAELTKYAANAMLATRISFMNEIARLAEPLGADIEQVRRGIGSDSRIGTQFLYAGCGWGGSCLPKDLRAIAHMAAQRAVPTPLLDAVQLINRTQRELLVGRVVERFGDDLRGLRFAIWGLAFKPNTDDLRDAPSRGVIEGLLAKGATVQAFDPIAMDNARREWPAHPKLVYAEDAMRALDDASALIVVTEWREFRSPDFAQMRARLRHPLLIDGRNLYDPAAVLQAGIEHVGIGRGRAAGAARHAASSAPHPLAA